MAVVFTIEEIREEVARVQSAYLAIIQSLLLADKYKSNKLKTIERFSLMLYTIWEEIKSMIEFDADNKIVISDKFNTDEWTYFRLPEQRVSTDRLNSMFDICKGIEAALNLSASYGVAYPETMPGQIDEQGQIVNPPQPGSPAGSGGNFIFLKKTIEVSGMDNVGGFLRGEKAEAGMESTDFVEKLLNKIIPATYEEPEIQLDSGFINAYSTVQVYSILDILMSPIFIKNDAGDIWKYEYYVKPSNQWQWALDSIATMEETHSFLKLFFSNENFYHEIKCIIYYQDGPIKLNSANKPSPEGQIKAGFVEKIFRITAKLPVFAVPSFGQINVWDTQYKNHFIGFIQSNSQTIEANIQMPENVDTINIFIPEGYELDVINSWIKQGVNGMADPVFQPGNMFGGNTPNMPVKIGLVITKIEGNDPDGYPYMYTNHWAKSMIGFESTLTVKLIINKTS